MTNANLGYRFTPEQRQAAKAKSLEVRRARAELKAGLARDIPLSRYLDDEAAQGMKVKDLLQAMPGIGPKRAMTILAFAGIPEKNTVRACGVRQLSALLRALQ